MSKQKLLAGLLLMLVVMCGVASADPNELLTGVSVYAYSGHYGTYVPEGCVNGNGLDVNGPDTHTNALGNDAAWYDGLNGPLWITFDLGGEGTLQNMKIWNANFAVGSPTYMWRYAQVLVSLTDPGFTDPNSYQDLGQIEIPQAPMTDTDPFGTTFIISHTGTIRYVKLVLNQKWVGGNTDAGLAEVQFRGDFAPVSVPLTLIGYWPLDGNAADASGNGNHGTALGAMSWVDGPKGLCAQFNGIDTGISIANPSAFEFDDEISLSFWVNQQPDQPAYAMVLNKMNNSLTAADGWMIFTGQGGWTTTGMNNWFKATAGAYGVRTSPSCVGEWHHVAVTVKGRVIGLYFDGFYYGGWGYDLPASMKVSTGNPLAFGCKSNPLGDMGSFWGGMLDEVRFYHGTLSLEDVKNLYQQGGGILCTTEPIAEDINQDCHVDLGDFAQLASHWLECYAYNNFGCDQ